MAFILYKWLLISCLSFAFPGGDHNTGSPARNEIFHPFYISVAEINHNSKEHSLELSCKVFAEDLEEIIKKNYKVALDLGNEKDKAKADQWINDYFHKHFAMVVDGKPVSFSYVGFEKDKESAFCYFEAQGINTVKKAEVLNTMLYDFNETQINIVHLTVNGKRQSNKVTYPERSMSFQF